MSTNLMESLSGVFNNELISKAASSLGESEGGITKLLGAGIPTVLSGILRNSGADSGANVLNLAKQAVGTGVLDNAGGIFSGSSNSAGLLEKGSGFLSGLFGSKVGALTSLISSFAGVKQSSVGSMLSAVAPLALGYIGKHALSNNLSGGGITSWLNGQKSQIAGAIPAGLNISGILDDVTPKVPHAVREAIVPEPKKSENNWLWPVLLGLLGIAALLYFLRGCNNDSTTPAVSEAVVTPEIKDTVAAIVTAPVESFMVTLPDGVTLNALKGGIEDKLVTFLNDAGSKAGKDVWFDFDNLNFETGSAKITAESQAQVNNIASILKAYPNVEIKIGGYTDVTGDAAANKKLSQDRATAVLAALTAAGAKSTQVVEAEGYGAQYAKAAADASDEERKKDRRIAVSVRKK